MKQFRADGLRYDVVFGLLMLAVAALGLRLALLIARGSNRAMAKVRTQQRMVTPIPARPGNVYASTRGGYVLLAGSRQAPACFVDPFILRDEELAETVVRVGDALGMDPLALQDLIVQRREARFVRLKRGLSETEVEAVRKLRIPAIGITHEWRRQYPNDALASAVLGFRRRDGIGGGGVELAMDAHLAAVDGRWVALADASRRPIWTLPDRSVAPADGKQVFLTIDAVIQGYLERALNESIEKFDAKWGVGVVIDPATGWVLGMASAPGFNPNRFNAAGASSRTNRAIVVPYEPGSALKPVFAAAAVDAGVIGYQGEIFCEDGVYHARRGGRISDHGHHYGWLTLTDVVVKSSNIGMAKVGEMLGNDAMYEIARRFGFGEPTGIDLPGESGGIVRPLDKWDTYSLRRIPFGQEISTTALQVAMAFASLANGGLLLRPQIVDRIVDAAGDSVYEAQPSVVRRVIGPQTSAQSVDVLRQVVERGTGRACKMDRWTSFGKTGTAQIPGPGGYVEGAYTGSFVGGAPASRPRVICLISIYWPNRAKGYYGSVVAAPYVKDVLSKTLTYLDVPSDR